MLLKKIKTNMESEICEQEKIIPYILNQYVDFETNNIKIDLPQNIKKIVLVASGSSYHCARFAVDLVEKISKIETRAIYSSEFLLKSIIPHDEGSLYIFITQSGETSDTIKSVQRVRQETNLPVLCVTNVENSAIWNICDYKVSCHAGEEHGIAATKSFTSQMLCLILISLKLVENAGNIDIAKFYINFLKNLPTIIAKTLDKRKEIKQIAKHLTKENVIVITADGISYSVAKEGALKIKETSYKNVTAAILGEFMHGHVAVLNNKSTLIYTSISKISERSINNINKIQNDYNPTLIVIGETDNRIKPEFYIDTECENEIQRLFSNVITMQLIAFETASLLHKNVDNPKGLHKVVIDKNV